MERIRHKLAVSFTAALSLAISAASGAEESHHDGHDDKANHVLDQTDTPVRVITAELEDDGELNPNHPNQITFRLTDQQGEPVDVSELDVVHTEPVHLLVIDPSFTDYHHAHPVQISPGEYTFYFTPDVTCDYRVWIDVKPSGGPQQYIPLVLSGSAIDPRIPSMKNCSASMESALNSTTSVDGMDFQISFDRPLRVGQPVTGKVKISKDGKPFDQLQPVMGAYAHVVGFYEDFDTVAHVHPIGPEPKRVTDRGGPEIEFHLNPQAPGYLKLFVQTQIDGNEVYAPFTVRIEE